MPSSCCAYGCSNRQDPGSNVGFFRIPKKEPSRRILWMQAIRRDAWKPNDGTRICGAHFIGGKPSDDPTDPDYVPSLFAFDTPLNTSTTKAKKERYARAQKRAIQFKENEDKDQKEREEEATQKAVVAEIMLDLSLGEPKYRDTGCQPDPDPLLGEVEKLKEEKQQLLQELGRLQTENDKLKKTEHNLINIFGESANRDGKVRCYTGLPSFAHLMWLINLLGPLIPIRKFISTAHQITLSLMKCKLNLLNEDLGYRFGISTKQVSVVLGLCLQIIAHNLKFLIRWPDRDTVMNRLPKPFKGIYSRCRIIIDCSEVFIERPKNLHDRAATYSNYKHHNTFKFLVGITPCGHISFLSKAWGGRASDKVITLQSGILDLLEPGDQVLADRGFLISEALALKNCSLAIPSFTRGKKQLSRKEVETSRQLARVRIHVERAIRRIKVFKILSDTMPITLLEYSDEILSICCALANLQGKLIK